MLYVHKNSGKRYHMLQELKMKVGNKWVDAVLYQCEKTSEKYVCSKERWENNFE